VSATLVAAMKPYERDESRVRALYRVPLPAGRQRILELSCGRTPLLPGEPWRGERAVSAILDDVPLCKSGAANVEQCRVDPREPLPFPAQSFDLVMLHGTLDALVRADAAWNAAGAREGLIARAAAALAPGGIVAGCVGNRTGLMGWRPNAPRGAATAGRGTYTMRSCAALLRRAGMHDVRVFNLVPNAAGPLAIFSTEWRLSRQAFLRELEVVRPLLRVPAYLARRAVAELALNRHFEDWLFFRAVRA